MSAHEIRRMREVYAEYERIGKWDTPNRGRQWMEQEREAALRHLFEGHSKALHELNILDIGCGGGKLLGWFHAQGASPEKLVGVDLMPGRVQRARQNHPSLTFLEANAEQLEFSDGAFDVVSVFTVFSSILDLETAKNVARSITRVLSSDGAVLWYDIRYPSPSNRNVRAMTKARIQELFPGFSLELEAVTLIPPLADRLGRYTSSLYPLLVKAPSLRSHYLGLLRKDHVSK